MKPNAKTPKPKCKVCDSYLKPEDQGRLRCTKCRARINRKTTQRLTKPRTPTERAYAERHRIGRRAATRRWHHAHMARKSDYYYLRTAIAAGAIKRPDHCQDCGKKCKPVPFGLAVDHVDRTVTVDAWVCWKDWWRRRKEAK